MRHPRAGNPLPGDSPWDRRSRGRRVSGGCDAGCAALAGRSPHDAPPTPVHPPATCRVVARAGPFAMFPGSLRNGVELPCGVDEHGAEDALPGAAEGWRVAVPRPANRRVRSTPRHAACSGSRRSALAMVWLERHDRPRSWRAAIAFPESPAPATPCAPRGAKPTISSPPLTSDSNRLPSGAPSPNPAILPRP